MRSVSHLPSRAMAGSKDGWNASLGDDLMCQRTSNRAFALVCDEVSGLEFWEVWDERMPFGSSGYRVVAIFHDFWFTTGDDGDWNGPFHSRDTCRRAHNDHNDRIALAA